MAARKEAQYLYLTTTGRHTKLPRQIEIWFTRHGGRYYLVAEQAERAAWVQNVLADDRVRFRVGRSTWRGRARVVRTEREPKLSALVQRLAQAKYGWGDGLVVELIPRARVE